MTCVQSSLRMVLGSALGDWVDTSELASIVVTQTGVAKRDELRELSLELYRQLLERGWARIGFLFDWGFLPWHFDDAETLARIDRAWRRLTAAPVLGDVCWLELTPAGEREARRLLRETS